VRDPFDGQVVRLGPAGREHDLVRLDPQESRDFGARRLDGVARLATEAVDARRIPVALLEVGQHGLHHLGMHGRRRVVIEIDTTHGSRHLAGTAARLDFAVSRRRERARALTATGADASVNR